MTGLAMAGASKADGRPLPWLDVPGFTPPQVQEFAAEASAEMGILTSMPMPSIAADSTGAAVEGAIGPDAGTVNATAQSGEAVAPTTQPTQQTPRAMPKDDDWDLPEGLGGNAFVPIEAD